jgi:tripartite-type tricarboxylate transporter receptor subunit TctC
MLQGKQGRSTPWVLGALTTFWALGVASACAEPGARSAGQDEARYPDRRITILSSVSPGGSSELLARAIASAGPKYFGQRIIVVTREGGGGAVALQELLRRPPDGYTLAITTSSGAVSMAAGRIPFTPDQFTYVERIQVDPYLIAVRSDSPFHDLTELFEYARSHPGALSVGGFGTASAHFLAFSLLRARAGNPDIRWIAYEGAGDASVATLGGHTDAVHTNYEVVREHVRAGTMRVLGVSASLTALPEVATYAEQGYDTAPVQWRGVQGHGDLPEALVVRIRQLLHETIQDPEFVAYMDNAGTELGLTEGAEAFRQAVKDEIAESRELLRGLHLLDAAEGGR